jgi:hypothetical protein
MLALKPRRGGTLLTVCFSLQYARYASLSSPAGTTLGNPFDCIVPAALMGRGGCLVRRLKPTVNKVSCLRHLKGQK